MKQPRIMYLTRFKLPIQADEALYVAGTLFCAILILGYICLTA